jgi:hypothetical protein
VFLVVIVLFAFGSLVVNVHFKVVVEEDVVLSCALFVLGLIVFHHHQNHYYY